MAIRSGVVTDVREPKNGGPWRMKIGGRQVQVWETDSDGLESPILQDLIDKEDTDEEVAVYGYTKTYKDKPQFTATDWDRGDEEEDADDAEEDEEKPARKRASKPQSVKSKVKKATTRAASKRGAPKKKFVGREPGTADNWVALRWAFSVAIEQLRAEGAVIWRTGEGLVPEVAELAGYIFEGSTAKLAEVSLGATEAEDGDE